MSPERGLSRSVEDYLKAVYSLTEGGEVASTSEIATALDVQPASVSGMVKRLAEAGLVKHERYHGVRLTDAGRSEALGVIRRHRILETFLVDRLGYTWGEVHEEAERLEHSASDLLIERMAAALEDPSYDPHGAPIPTRAGEIEEVDYTSLAEAEAGATVEIRAVADEDAARLAYLDELGLTPGVLVLVEGKAPFEGPLTLHVRGPNERIQIVGREIARRVFVVPRE